MSKVIRVENLSKQYRIGDVGTGSLAHDLNRFWHKARGKEDPYLLIGEENDRESKGSSDYVWALKDLNFEIEQGDRVGIIGRNGAGKSTLLKILSRTTSPTRGRVTIKGKVASLLEVGTGFHPELSGRDNIFLNGAILGMSKKDIKSRFDEIVDFAGIERYIDTPVKRYSSGMYVRLAFAVAAHLESDILIVDEVLAVGDAEFQRKCLGKMSDISNGAGKTILFVSHNMASISTLTTNCVCLENGEVKLLAKSSDVIKAYLNNGRALEGVYNKPAAKNKPSITRIEVRTSETNQIHLNGQDLIIEVVVFMPIIVEGMALSIQIINSNEIPVVFTYIFDTDSPLLRKIGQNKMKCIINSCMLYEDDYSVTVHLAESKGKTKFEEICGVCKFEVQILNKTIEWGWQKNVCVYTEKFHWETVV